MISEDMRQQVEKSSVIRQMFEEGNRLSELYGAENVFDFSLGNPNVPAPESINESIVQIAKNTETTKLHGYMNNAGFPEVRRKIAESINRKYSTNYDETNICMCVGAAGGMNVIFKSILNPGDEVVVMAPFFGEYRGYVSNFGGVLTVVPPNPPFFRPDAGVLSDYISPKTKAVIINTPNNPTGVIYSEEDIKNIAEVLNEKKKEYGIDIALISDEPYRELAYDGAKVPFIPDFYDDTFVCYSFSKSLSLPGERIGYIIVPDTMKNHGEVMTALSVATRILGFVNAPSLMQLVVAENTDAEVNLAAYDKNRKALYEGLTALGFECVLPEGAFYLFMKSPIESDSDFCEIAKRENILLVPGSAFGCPGYVRIAYCVAYDTIINSMDGFANIAKSLKGE